MEHFKRLFTLVFVLIQHIIAISCRYFEIPLTYSPTHFVPLSLFDLFTVSLWSTYSLSLTYLQSLFDLLTVSLWPTYSLSLTYLRSLFDRPSLFDLLTVSCWPTFSLWPTYHLSRLTWDPRCVGRVVLGAASSRRAKWPSMGPATPSARSVGQPSPVRNGMMGDHDHISNPTMF